MKEALRLAMLLLLWAGLATAESAVVRKNVHLRADPSIRHTPIATLRPFVELELLEPKPTNGFYHVRTDSGQEGWVWGQNIKIKSGSAANPHSHKTGVGGDDDQPHHHPKKGAKKAKPPGSVGDSRPPIPSFPWPPPAASASEQIPNDLLAASATLHSLGDINTRLAAALEKSGYAEKKYYAVPNGFALVTRLEQIEADGRPKPEPDRWSSNSPAFRSLSDYLRALFSANPGHYRVIVLIVTDVPFAESEKRVSEAEAVNWLHAGLNRLPPEIAERPYNPDVVSTALIYEFEKDQGKDPQLNEPSRLGAHEHLTHSGIWGALGV